MISSSETSQVNRNYKNLLVCQPCDLGIEPKSRIAFFLRDFQLPLLIFADIRDPDVSTERRKYTVFGLVDRGRQFCDLLVQIVVVGLDLWTHSASARLKTRAQTFASSGAFLFSSLSTCFSSSLMPVIRTLQAF